MDHQHQPQPKQDSQPKSISDFIDLYLPVCRGIDYIKSDTNSELLNVRCGILWLAPVKRININCGANKNQIENPFSMSIDLYLQVYIGTDSNTNSEFPNVHCEALKMAANFVIGIIGLRS